MSLPHNFANFGKIAGWVFLLVVLAVCLFSGSPTLSANGLTASSVGEIKAVLNDAGTQWIVFLCFGSYCLAFLFLRSRAVSRFWKFTNPDVWLIGALLLGAFVYALWYSPSGLALTFICGAVLCLGAGTLRKRENFLKTTVSALGLLLALASVWSESSPASFEYLDLHRWSGPWENPNVYGMLMGVGAILAVGKVVQSSKFKVQSQVMGAQGPSVLVRLGRDRRSKIQSVFALFWSLATMVCGIGLFKSYSRGAWIATGVGIGYLIFQLSSAFAKASARQGGAEEVQSWAGVWISGNWHALALIAVSVMVMAFWQFRFTEWRPARRVFSIANINDFSWRNRVTAWEGAMRMMADKPLFGYGWGAAEDVYQKHYCPPQLKNGLAIQMNDYLLLGVSAGIPVLICFVIYVGLSLRSSKFKVQSSKSEISTLDTRPLSHEQTLDWSKTVCRAGAIVLLVGFWFDGGLFKLATGSVFWILLELGRINTKPQTPLGGTNTQESEITPPESSPITSPVTRHPSPETSPWLKWAAGLVASLALIETIVLVGSPFLPVSRATLAIARHWLVPPKATGDLDYLAATLGAPQSRQRGSKTPLKILLQHASLASYNRQLVNWLLDDKIYRDYVLTPTIDPQRDGQLAWRRTLWEYFYPPMRHENDPAAAAEIVVKFLRQRVTSIAQGPATIEEMWKEQKADAKGFEALKVAAFRAVGIPARLNEAGQAELFSGGKWQPGAR